MKTFLRNCAAVIAALPAIAAAQSYGSAGVSKMTAAYNPTADAVVITDQPADYAVQQAAVYQPPGRVYGVNDPFATSGGTPPLSIVPTSPQTTVAPPSSTWPVTPSNPNMGQQPPIVPYGSPPIAAPGYCPPIVPCNPVVPCYPGVTFDPYACYPSAPVAGAAASLRQPYFEIEGRMGDPPEALQGNLMLPFWQEQDVFWFFDIRGQYDDERAGEGNFGVARREKSTQDHFTSFYAFYDLRHTEWDNNFHQMTLGFERMGLDWEWRINGYLPMTNAQATGQAIAQLDNSTNNIVVREGLERAYYGFDAEYGWLFWRLGGGYDHEIRGYLGGYYFDTDQSEFPSLGGPRARLEGRLYDCPVLGAGSRFTYGATYQWDDVRESQWILSLNLRIPFGRASSSAAKLTPLERRMVEPLRRDAAIVTYAGFGKGEQAVLNGGNQDGLVLTDITEVRGGQDLPTRIQEGTVAGSDIFVVTGNVSSSDTAELGDGQFLGGQFKVRGQNSGTAVTFGRKHKVQGTNPANDVLEIASNATVTGLKISGGDNGISGNDVSGFTISNNVISSTGGDGIHLSGEISGDILDNKLNDAAGSGIDVDALVGGTISGNSAEENAIGYSFQDVTGGLITDNSATSNDDVGFQIDGDMSGGALVGNTADDNSDAGFLFNGDFNGGAVAGNIATGSTQDTGFQFEGDILSGSITDNTATSHTGDGYYFDRIVGGSVNGNISNSNSGDGFQVDDFEAGGVFSHNTANDNTFMGFHFPGTNDGVANENSASGNGNNTLP